MIGGGGGGNGEYDDNIDDNELFEKLDREIDCDMSESTEDSVNILGDWRSKSLSSEFTLI